MVWEIQLVQMQRLSLLTGTTNQEYDTQVLKWLHWLLAFFWVQFGALSIIF